MKTTGPTYDVHVFVCTNSKDNGPCCAQKNAKHLREDLKKLARTHLNVRINASGCLGQCENGITAVIYPQAKWFSHLSEMDAQKLLAEVESLLLDETK